MPRCDLQVHSRYSDRPSEWVLRKLGIPRSYTQPQQLYQKLKEKGFDFVTMTDHNRIDGCREISHLPGVFFSEEVTTYFPEDGCKIHLLVWNVTEAQHAEIESIRPDIYQLTTWLNHQGIAHGVAHPLYNLNGKLSPDHFEKLILLFRVFEVMNGSGSHLAQEIALYCLQILTPEMLGEMSARHKLEPTHDHPWQKSFIGGSDDHGGLYIGSAWTEVDGAATPGEFLQHVMAGRCRPCGQHGDALRLSSSLYHIITSYARDRLGASAPQGLKLMSKVAERFLAGQNPTHIPLSEKLSHLAEAVRTGRAFDFLKPSDPSFNRQLAFYFTDPKVSGELDRIVAEEPNTERRVFKMSSKIANDLLFRLFLEFLRQANRGEFLDSLQPLAGMIPVAGAISPYFFSFYNLHGDRQFLTRVAKRFRPLPPPSLENNKRAWFTDTLEDVNGVARTIRAMCKSSRRAGRDVTVITSRSTIEIDDITIKNFPPVGEFELPEYELQKLSFPPILDIIDYVERERFTECIISTPGPIGLSALVAAKLLGLRTCAIYHTDFPQYVRILTEDEFLETMAWSFMYWFYSQVDLVFVNSAFYRNCWVDRGIAPSKLAVFPRGLDTELFNPGHRQEDYWKKRGAKGTVLLYVGRVSKEKELPFLVEVLRELKKREKDVTLAVVGDGPYRTEMMQQLPEAIFTGILTGVELGRAYSSADLFVFPSTTDTFGNVVIEALSSGLPVFVSDVGGPKELITHEHEGRVLPANNLAAWAGAISSFLQNPITRDQSLTRANLVQTERSWDDAFRRFWAYGNG